MRNCVLTLLVFLLVCNLALGQDVKVTQTDTLIVDKNMDEIANPGDSIRYKVTITVNGDSAKNVVLDTMNFDPALMIDMNSLHIGPLARKDTFECIGNVGLDVPAMAGLLSNDADLDNNSGTLTITMVGATTTNTAVLTDFTTVQNGTANVNADGSFTYTPAAGFNGTDQFRYKLSDGDPVTADVVQTVCIIVTDVIWFVQNDHTPNANPNDNGTLADPFNALSAAESASAIGHTIFLYEGDGTSTGQNAGITLKNNQIFIGEGAGASIETISGITLPSHSNALPSTGGAKPLIASTVGPGITVASDNTIRGLNIGATSDMGIKNTAMSSVGTLTVSEVSITGTGGGIAATNGGTFSVTLDEISTTSHTGSLVNLSGVGGTLNVNGGGASGVTGDVIEISGGNINMTYGGTLTNTAARLIDIQNTTGGTILLNGASLSDSGAGTNTGEGIYITGCAGNVTIDATATSITDSDVSGINILGACTGTFRFDDVTITGPTAAGVNINGDSGGNNQLNGTVDLNNVDVSSSTGAPVVSIEGIGSGSVDFDVASSIMATGGGGGVLGNSNGGGSATFNGPVSLTTNTNTGVNLTSNAGATFNFFGGLTISTTSGIGFNATGGGTVNVTGGSNTITKSEASNAININSTDAGSFGITFSSINVTGGTGTAVNIVSSAGIKSLGDIDVARASGGTGISASTAGTLITTTGDINSGSNSAIDIDNTVLGMTLKSVISNGGTAPGIDLVSTTGSFTITGDGADMSVGGNNSGGSISSKTGADGNTGGLGNGGSGDPTFANIDVTIGVGVRLIDASNVTLRRMRINGHTNYAVFGRGVNTFNLEYSKVDGTNGTSTSEDEGSVRFVNLTGSSSILNTIIEGGHEDNFNIINNTGTLNRCTVSGSTIGLNSTSSGNDGVTIESRSTATMNMTVQNSSFTGARGDMLQCNCIDQSTMDCVVKDNTFNNNHTDIVSGGGGITISGGGATANINMTYEVSGTTFGSQTFTKAKGFAVTANFVSGTGNVVGTIKNNHIGTPGVSGSGSTEGGGILAGAAGTVFHSVLIENNQIRRLGSGGGTASGIDVVANMDNPGGTQPEMDVTILGNNVAELEGSGGFAGLNLTVAGAGTENGILNLDIRNNTFDASGGTFASSTIFMSQFNNASNFNVENYTGSANGELAFACAPGTASADLRTFLSDATRNNTLIDGPFIIYPGVDASFACGITGLTFIRTSPNPKRYSEVLITNKQIDNFLARSSHLFEQGSNLIRHDDLIINLKILASNRLAQYTKNKIELDLTAAGHGWFVDPTPDQNEEFTLQSDGSWKAIPDGPAHGKMDLLTVLLHELGHMAGKNHDPNDLLMQETLDPGTRKLPTSIHDRE